MKIDSGEEDHDDDDVIVNGNVISVFWLTSTNSRTQEVATFVSESETSVLVYVNDDVESKCHYDGANEGDCDDHPEF